MRRREFIMFLAGAPVAGSLAVRAQQAGKLPTVALLWLNASVAAPLSVAFIQRLRELGWIEGRTGWQLHP